MICNPQLMHKLVEMYAQSPRNMFDDIAMIKQRGYIFEEPDCLVMGYQASEGWYCHVAIGEGALDRFVLLMPFYLPYVGWARALKGRDEVKWYRTDSLLRRLNLTMHDIVLRKEQLLQHARTKHTRAA